MEAPITITQCELLSLLPEVHSQVRDSTTMCRIPNTEAITSQKLVCVEEEDELPPMPRFAVQHAHHHTPPDGVLIIPDPIEAYYKSLGSGKTPDPNKLKIAATSAAIRSIYTLVDNSQQWECTTDGGFQVVTMSESTCHDLGLTYDPSIKLNMESANGEINQLLGLAHNVSFQIGPIIIYLQVHIIKSPAYDILLGQPFNILTESVIRNFANKDQIITICNPNSGQWVTIPTLSRLCPAPLQHFQRTVFLERSVTGNYRNATCNSNMNGLYFSNTIPQSDSPKLTVALSYLDTFPTKISTTNDTKQISTPVSKNLPPTCRILNNVNNHDDKDPQTAEQYITYSGKKKYKPVAKKVKPVISELPEKFWIIWNITGNPLQDLPVLNSNPLPFTPTSRYTQEQKELFNKINLGFLLPAEHDLLHHFMMVHQDAFTWETSECSHFREDFLPPVEIHTSHTLGTA